MTDNSETGQSNLNPESSPENKNPFVVENHWRKGISEEMINCFSDSGHGFRKKGIGHDIYQTPDFPLRAVDVSMGRWISESDKDLVLRASFGLQDQPFLDTDKVQQLLTSLNSNGFTTSIKVGFNGQRSIVVDAGVDKFSVDIGYPDLHSYFLSLQESMHTNRNNQAALDAINEHYNKVIKGEEKPPSIVSVNMNKNGRDGKLPIESAEEASYSLETFERVVSSVGAGLIKGLSGEKTFEPVKLHLVRAQEEELLRSTETTDNNQVLRNLSHGIS